MIRPDGDDYWVRTTVWRWTAFGWAWQASLRQRRRWLPNELAYMHGRSLTEGRARRAADRAARRMKREAASLRSEPARDKGDEA